MGGGNLHRTPAAGVSRSVRSYALALCMAFAIAAVPVQAQVKNITLKASNTPVSTVMQQIEEQSGYTFFYNTKDIPLDRNVTLSVANKDIRAALDELFRNTNVSYSIDNKSIILSARGGAQPQQASQITGRIVDKNGVPVIGATIMISGTTQGTTSGVDGTFALQSNVSPAGMVLDVSFIGYKPQRISVNNRTSLSVTLEEDDQQIEAVVVTALGIKRQERAVSYNVQNISDEVFLTRDANMVNSLAGKIAGVTINASAAGVGGETKVVMRGSKSIAGSNNALYVLDGIPLPSLSLTNPGDEFTIMRENNLTGDGISNFNLDDIASMAALTGPSAAALYGTQRRRGRLGQLQQQHDLHVAVPNPGLPEHLRSQGRLLRIVGFETRHQAVVDADRLLPDGIQHFELGGTLLRRQEEPDLCFGGRGDGRGHHSEQRIQPLQLHGQPQLVVPRRAHAPERAGHVHERQ